MRVFLLAAGYSILLKAGWNRHRLRDANIGALAPVAMLELVA
jgi:hypothetical protein